MTYCRFCMAKIEDGATECPACGKKQEEFVPPHHLLPGTLLTGRYVVGVALGEGGFGITYIGRDNLFDSIVAIKEYYPSGYANRSNTISAEVSLGTTANRIEFFDNGKKRFLKEAKTLARFNREEGVVNVIDFFEENSTAYIVMEYLDGQTLKAYIEEKGTLTPDETVKLLIPVMKSLEKVHAHGLIHRDISPDNIMLTKDGVKLLDFGAARTVSAQANKSLSIMLKPGYAPEEQYRSKGSQGPWTDVYALCATMYKCITGITPDDATQRVYSDEVRAPSELGIEISPRVDKAIMKGLAVNQADRFQTVAELLKALTEDDDAGAVLPPIAPAAEAAAAGAGVVAGAAAGAGVAAGKAEGAAAAGTNDGGEAPSAPKKRRESGRSAGTKDQKKQKDQKDQKEKKEKGLILIPIIGVLAAACIGVSIFFLSRSKGGDDGVKSDDSIIIAPSGTPFDVTAATPLNDSTEPPDNTAVAVSTETHAATSTAVPTQRPTATATNTAIAMSTRTPSPAPTRTATATPAHSAAAASTPTPTPTSTPTSTPTRTPTSVPTRTPTPTPTRTPTPAPTRTPTPKPTRTPTPTPTSKPTPTPTPVPTMRPVNSDSMYYYNDHCYTIINGSYNWSEAEAYCEELGGHLATVTSQGEQNFIMSINSSNQCLWLGGYRIGTNSWGWVTGETWSYTYWGEGEPNDSTNVVSEENRVCTFPMYWNDLNENNLYEQDGFICEWDDNTCIRYWIDYLGLASNDSEVNTADCFIRPIAGLYDTYFPIGQGSKLYLLGWALFDDGLDYLYYDLDGKQYKINGPYRNRSDASADTAPYYGRAGYHNGENAGFGNDGEYCELTAVRELKKGNHDIEIVAVSRYGNKHTLLYGTIYVE